jgi:tRNA splicing endonuclease
MPDKPLKSSFELAMDRLKAKDRAEGVEEAAPLTQKQKNRIAELRAEAQAKLAELEILHRKNVAGTSDPEQLKKIEENYATDRGRAESRRESEIAKVRRGDI